MFLSLGGDSLVWPIFTMPVFFSISTLRIMMRSCMTCKAIKEKEKEFSQHDWICNSCFIRNNPVCECIGAPSEAVVLLLAISFDGDSEGFPSELPFCEIKFPCLME